MKNICNLFIVDTSPSMQGEKIQAARDGLNAALNDVRTAEGNNYTQIVYFDSTVRDGGVFMGNKAITNVETLNVQGGGTALFDAICEGVNRLPKGFDGGIVNIFTDGEENSSRTYSAKDVKKCIKKLRKKNWLVSFVGADEESLKAAQSLGVSKSMTRSFNNDATEYLYSTTALNTTNASYRTAMTSETLTSLDDFETDNAINNS